MVFFKTFFKAKRLFFNKNIILGVKNKGLDV